jgi:Ala-tRNA(Pro) deacylase
VLDREGVLAILRELDVVIDEHAHPAVFTSDEAEAVVKGVGGARAKNLFLRDRKGRRHFLLVIRPQQRIDLAALGEQLHTSALSLASPQRLQRYLGVTPGSVSLLALLNDVEDAVELVVDAQLWRSDAIQCHPLDNTHTLCLDMADLRRTLARSGHQPRVMALPQG